MAKFHHPGRLGGSTMVPSFVFSGPGAPIPMPRSSASSILFAFKSSLRASAILSTITSGLTDWSVGKVSFAITVPW
ncbi:hypothetical protein D3C73_1184290 [compost metagenome]